MGLFGPSKKKVWVESGPDGSAADRLQYYVDQAQTHEATEMRPRKESRRDRKEREAREAREAAAPDIMAEPEPPKAAKRESGEVFDSEFHPMAKAAPQRREAPIMDLESRHPDDDLPDHEPRSFTSKMFGVGWAGYVQLVLLCVGVGAVFQAGGINPFDPGFTWAGAVDAAGKGVVTVVSWAFGNGWQPFLVGLMAVAPVWLAWRLLTIPFRR